MFSKTFVSKFLAALIVSVQLLGCNDKSKDILSTDTWACPIGATLQTWPDGYPGKEKKYKAIGCNDKNGDRVGFHIAWRDYGKKEHEGEFVNDKPDGEWSYFHEDGALSSRGFYRKGKLEGIWSSWDEDGNFKYDKKYKDGLLIEKLGTQT